MTDIAIIVPMLGRPHTIGPLVDSINATCEARILFVCSPGDTDVIAALNLHQLETIIVPGPGRGDYAKKINAGYRHTTEPLLFTGACDLKFHDGWYVAAVNRLVDGIGVVGTNDLGSQRVMAGLHSTHSLVTRAYVDRFGTIDGPGVLHEGYLHEFVDDEFVQTAMHRNAWAFAGDSHVEHLHPAWGKALSDESYNQAPFRMRMGRKLYRQREHLWT